MSVHHVIAFIALVGFALTVAGCAPESQSSPAADQQGSASGSARQEMEPIDASSPVGEKLRSNVSPLKGSVADLNVRVTEFGRVVDLPSDALFEYGKADLTPSAETQLRKAAEIIRSSPNGNVIGIVGHTDSHGSETDNQSLSVARARTVADWLKLQPGIRQREFAVSGKGEAEPLAPNATAAGKDDPAARARNRRVEIILPGQ